jgi:hypothetical protein
VLSQNKNYAEKILHYQQNKLYHNIHNSKITTTLIGVDKYEQLFSANNIFSLTVSFLIAVDAKTETLNLPKYNTISLLKQELCYDTIFHSV